ncbi:MAG TPA: TonB-dependent receptor, partial [Bryobacteraceae bacterium]|nr:TonB-dependent receptor [Bryobacteraceae bacterium]
PDLRAQQFEIYLQDDWKVRPNLTLNLGLRYSMFRQPVDARNQLTTFDPASFLSSQAAVITSSGTLAANTPSPYLNGIIIGGQNSPYGSKISTQDQLNFAPRFGFAWDPFSTGKTAIRGGYGIFYDSTLVGTFEQNIFANPPFVNSVTIPNVPLDNPTAGSATVSNSPKVLRGTATVFPTPYTQQWSFEIQRQIAPSTLLSVAYVGTKGTHLLGIVDLNTVVPGLAYSSGLVSQSTVFTSANEPLLNQIRPFKGYNAVNMVEPWFNSNYNSLQVNGQKNFKDDSLIGFAYTWSKNLTDNQTDRSTAPQNVYNFNKGEYGLAQYDRRHVFSLNFVYTLPFFRQQSGLTGKLLGGWQVSGIASYYTGLPLTVTTTGTDPAGLGIIGSSAAGLRPDLTCDPNTGSNNRLMWFNTACFTNGPAGQHRPGNAGRGIVKGPGYEGWNVSASKNLLFHEGRFRLQIRGEATNLLNHANPNVLGVTATTATTFGMITSYRDPRIIQLAGKFYF